MRRFLALVVLPLLLLAGQQGAWRHGLSHMGVAALAIPHTTAHDEGEASGHSGGDAPCLECLAFAPLGGAAPASPAVFQMPALAFQQPVASVPATLPAPPPAPRSRGPPAAA